LSSQVSRLSAYYNFNKYYYYYCYYSSSFMAMALTLGNTTTTAIAAVLEDSKFRDGETPTYEETLPHTSPPQGKWW